MHLRLRGRHDLDDRNDPPVSPSVCIEHVWRLRGVTFALPGSYICEVCEQCGALQIDGPSELTGMFGVQPEPRPATESFGPSRHDDGSELEALARSWSRDCEPPSPST